MANEQARALLLQISKALYLAARAAIFRQDAQTAHEAMIRLLARLDTSDAAQSLLRAIHRIGFSSQPALVGGVRLPYPLMLAAGFVKGHGFHNEEQALTAVERGENIIPGWRTMPTLVGPVEFGSFTRWPRTGNPGVVLWRDPATRSTQNRIGLRNPGARAAAEFLARRPMPPVYGINIAASPGVTEREQEAREIGEAFDLFLDRGLRPAWFTLNLSCPNTEDDPGARQTEEQARDLCGAAGERLREVNIPLWVKIGPCLSEAQYTALMRVFADTGVRAVIATNTMPQPTPEAPGVVAGVGGGRLHAAALDSVRMLARIRREFGHKTDIIGCGGVIDPTSFIAIQNAGAGAAQYWSALIYRGPLAAALILDDRPQNERNIAL